MGCLDSTQAQISDRYSKVCISLAAEEIQHLLVTPLQWFTKTIILIKATGKQIYLPQEGMGGFFSTNFNHLKGTRVVKTTHLDSF